MPITVNSPYSGRPVKIRDQDVGRAVRDEDGRVFYVVPRSEGQGYYAAPTRHGSPKDEQRYDEMQLKMEQVSEQSHEQQAIVRDATGKKRSPVGRWLFLLILLIALGAGGYYWFVIRPSQQTDPTLPANPASDTSQPAPESDPELDSSDIEKPTGSRTITVAADQRIASRSTVVHASPSDVGEFKSLASGLMFRDNRKGVGEPASAGNYLRLRYRDKSFESPTELADQPWQTMQFVLWSGQAPRGWDEALAGMRVGASRTALIPQFDQADMLRYDVAEFELLEVLPGVTWQVELTGNGPLAKPGDRVTLHYRAFVRNGKEAFDDTRQRQQPVSFVLGRGTMIEGLELGIAGMQVGELRTLTIPPHLAYGSRKIGDVIPADATLVFLIELLDIEPA